VKLYFELQKQDKTNHILFIKDQDGKPMLLLIGKLIAYRLIFYLNV
jgi:hypothetical protein